MSDTSLFGTRHIVFIVISALLIVGLYFLSRKVKIEALSKILLGIGLASETIKVFSYIVISENKEYVEGVTYGGVLPKTDLPFHLCSLQIFFILIAVISKNEKLKRFIFSFMMPSCLFGGIAAILIATSSARTVWIILIQYFTYHIAIVVFALRLISAKEMEWRAKDYLNCLIFLVGVIFFSVYINSILFDGVSKINFMYVVDPPQDGLPYLNKNNGWLSYIIRYLALVLVGITATYSKAIITSIIKASRDRKAKKKS